MTDDELSRRSFVKQSALAAAAAFPLGSPHSAQTASLKVVCVGAHPDDPESGCGGTLARYAALGHSVTIVYLTRGERGIDGRSLDEAARIRTAESEAACRIMGAKPVFFGQIDGATEFTRAQVESMTRLLNDERPDVLFTHWPVDTHPDHQVASLLAIRGWMRRGTGLLYFFEVDTGDQTEGFFPNTYVDVSTVMDKKKSALFAHVSQDGQAIWRQHHEIMAAWRGREAAVPAAEAFVHLNRDQSSSLPGL
jgi:LmbE family N-acetylglucosaminyl deacetylase